MTKAMTKALVLAAWCALLVFFVHQGAIRPELRYSRVAEGNISKSVHAIWSQGWNGYLTTLGGNAWWGRVRPMHELFHSIPFALTAIRNGDIFCSDPTVPLSERINGDLQTHSIFLLACFSLTLGGLAMVLRHATGSWWSGLLLPILCVPGNRYLSQNLLVNFSDSGEIGQLLFLGVYLGLAAPLFACAVPGQIRETAAVVFLAATYAMKETSVVLLPIMLAVLGWLALDAPSRFRHFALRHAICHALMAGILLLTVLTVKSGAYVSQNYTSSDLGCNLRKSWMYMTVYSPAVPYLLVALAFSSLLWICMRDRKSQFGKNAQPSWSALFAFAGICAGFWAINIPWGQSIDKYYLPVNVFACMCVALILHMSVDALWSLRLRPAAVVWAAGSLIYLLGDLDGRVHATDGYYILNYEHRKAVPCVVEDIAQTVRKTEQAETVHIVADHLYQEGALPFMRWINRFHGLNIAEHGQIVAHMSEIERNYFRRYEDVPAVELTMSGSVPDGFSGHALYCLVEPTAEQRKDLEFRGYEAAGYWDPKSSGTGIWKFTRTN